jgi:hypothetical protein
MKERKSIIIPAVLALLLGLVSSIRIGCERRSFAATVREAHETSEGYDQKFIDMVNRLEDILATRASFGFMGKKDPMTGRTRVVAEQSSTPVRRTGKQAVKKEEDFKITAIIFDDNSNPLAAVGMDGERSFSLEVGDFLRDKKVMKITSDGVIMANETHYFLFDINGNVKSKKR